MEYVVYRILKVNNRYNSKSEVEVNITALTNLWTLAEQCVLSKNRFAVVRL